MYPYYGPGDSKKDKEKRDAYDKDLAAQAVALDEDMSDENIAAYGTSYHRFWREEAKDFYEILSFTPLASALGLLGDVRIGAVVRKVSRVCQTCFSCNRTVLTLASQGGTKRDKAPRLVSPPVTEPEILNLADPVNDISQLTRLLGDNEKTSGTHRILVRSKNLMALNAPAFDKIIVKKFNKRSGGLNSAHFRKLAKEARSKR
jgi:hypothetical protein